jgi:hypothetical protein
VCVIVAYGNLETEPVATGHWQETRLVTDSGTRVPGLARWIAPRILEKLITKFEGVPTPQLEQVDKALLDLEKCEEKLISPTGDQLDVIFFPVL